MFFNNIGTLATQKVEEVEERIVSTTTKTMTTAYVPQTIKIWGVGGGGGGRAGYMGSYGPKYTAETSSAGSSTSGVAGGNGGSATGGQGGYSSYGGAGGQSGFSGRKGEGNLNSYNTLSSPIEYSEFIGGSVLNLTVGAAGSQGTRTNAVSDDNGQFTEPTFGGNTSVQINSVPIVTFKGGSSGAIVSCSVAIVSGVGTVTTSSVHQLSIGNVVYLESSASLVTVASIPSSTTFTFTTGAANTSYNTNCRLNPNDKSNGNNFTGSPVIGSSTWSGQTGSPSGKTGGAASGGPGGIGGCVGGTGGVGIVNTGITLTGTYSGIYGTGGAGGTGGSGVNSAQGPSGGSAWGGGGGGNGSTNSGARNGTSGGDAGGGRAGGGGGGGGYGSPVLDNLQGGYGGSGGRGGGAIYTTAYLYSGGSGGAPIVDYWVSGQFATTPNVIRAGGGGGGGARCFVNSNVGSNGLTGGNASWTRNSTNATVTSGSGAGGEILSGQTAKSEGGMGGRGANSPYFNNWYLDVAALNGLGGYGLYENGKSGVDSNVTSSNLGASGNNGTSGILIIRYKIFK